MKKVSAPKVVTTAAAIESPLPPQIQEALGELVGAAREGLFALSVGVGLGVVHELMELEVDDVVGPKGKWNPDRAAKRHGHEDSSMTLGGRRVKVSRPRMRTVSDEHELPVQSYEYFADRDPLTRAVMDRSLPSPRALRSRTACRPNSISRVFSAFSSRPNFASLPRSSAQNRSASSRYSNPTTKSSAQRTMIMSPCACRDLHW
jgi:putative transposase